METKDIAMTALFGAVVLVAIMAVFSALAPKEKQVVTLYQAAQKPNQAVTERASRDTVTKRRSVQTDIQVVADNVQTRAIIVE